ncbi:MAG: glycine zipper domain-containing protein [Phycisphaerae bacterium]
MAKNLITILMVVAVSLGLAFVAGCESDAQTGALIGAGVGAIAGQAIGGDTESTLIGAGVGAAGGYIIGNEQDKKK